MKLWTVIFQSPTPPSPQDRMRDIKKFLGNRTLAGRQLPYKLHFSNYTFFFQCSQRYFFVLYFWNTKYFKYSILNSVFYEWITKQTHRVSCWLTKRFVTLGATGQSITSWITVNQKVWIFKIPYKITSIGFQLLP